MTAEPRLRLIPMRPRDPGESGRVASSLELFFDLVFVIAVSVAAVQLHHALSAGHVIGGILSYAAVFFAVWWAWMNFTWFATSFDTDDWLYRVMTIVQMGGVLVLAAGVAPAFEHHDFTIVTLGYVVMRLAMVTQWLRAARGAGDARPAALTYAAGIAAVQVLWLLALLMPAVAFPVVFVLLVLAEISVPVLAERRGATPWHPHHITERFGLFTLILLGESLLASANAVIEALGQGEEVGELIAVAVLTLVATASLWWIYFWPSHHHAIRDLRSSLRYGYSHYVIFAAAGAFSAGIEVEIDVIAGHSELAAPWASFAFTIPLALFVLGVWAVAIRPRADRVVNIAIPLAGLLVLVDPIIPVPFALTALILAVAVAVLEWRGGDGERAARAEPETLRAP
ncbi:low temperature requirement protein A [Brachybacterium sp. NBEC-018]|uniref:low temperature requirement protein A n=1 Tax=Brachybacterium sp. NBEC-018 TaxID=2996004 RepID=UPI002174E9BB|nr:low temperature requirement protein A [Brachybacterium sp. NBEC-018]UVY85580.1 low temperature requirement protein A [Brachybacterium sp. NBEC-018]